MVTEGQIIDLGWVKTEFGFDFESTKVDKSNPNAYTLNGEFVSDSNFDLQINRDGVHCIFNLNRELIFKGWIRTEIDMLLLMKMLRIE